MYDPTTYACTTRTCTSTEPQKCEFGTRIICTGHRFLERLQILFRENKFRKRKKVARIPAGMRHDSSFRDKVKIGVVAPIFA